MARLVGCMFLTMLHDLEKRDELKPTSTAANLGLIMGLYMQLFSKLHEDFGLLEEESEKETDLGGFLAISGTVLSYAHGVELDDGDALEDLVREIDETGNVGVGKGEDPYGWEKEYRDYSAASVGKVGGDRWDITTWKPKERKEAEFDGEDPMSRAMLNHIKSGAPMQLG